MSLKVIRIFGAILYYAGLLLFLFTFAFPLFSLRKSITTYAVIAFLIGAVILVSLSFFIEKATKTLLGILYLIWLSVLSAGIVTGFAKVAVWCCIILLVSTVIWGVFPSLSKAVAHLVKSYRKISEEDRT